MMLWLIYLDQKVLSKINLKIFTEIAATMAFCSKNNDKIGFVLTKFEGKFCTF
jgi:hypothetical protein